MVTRRLALSSLFHGKPRDTPVSPPPPPATAATPAAWPWPSSKNPAATRAAQPQAAAAGARTIASIVVDSAESSFTASSAWQDCCSDSLSTASEASAAAACDDAADDAVVRGVRSDRLLFDPGASATNSILEEKSAASANAKPEEEEEEEAAAFGGAVAVAFESADPYADFRASMAEMVAAQGVGDWGWLEEMLGWYLRANDADTHCAIVAAFIDVVVAIADPAREACPPQAESCTFQMKLTGFIVYNMLKSWDGERLSFISDRSGQLMMEFLLNILKSNTDKSIENVPGDLQNLLQQINKL